ncbi:MAG: hypothetical protein ACOYZ7_00965 [Chloroflexota bacterium]
MPGSVARHLPYGETRPTPTPRPEPTPTSSNPNQQCPATRTTTTPPAVKVWVEPPYPVVIAQDPQQRGVDVNVQITSYPVHYEWQEWEVVGAEHKCGCDNPATPTGDAECYNGEFGCPNVNPNPCDQGWADWKWYDVPKYGCAWHEAWLPDPIDTSSISLWAVLTPSSREWITEELALKYPGLKLRHPDWRSLAPHWDVSFYDDLSCVARTTVNVPAEDPGIYDLSLGGRTSGTRHSGGQPFGFSGNFSVYFLGETLVK